MRIPRLLLVTCTLGTALAACGESSADISAPDQALFDGGSGFGSGHRVSSDSTNTGAVPSPSEKTADDSTVTAERGGSGFGSGH